MTHPAHDGSAERLRPSSSLARRAALSSSVRERLSGEMSDFVKDLDLVEQGAAPVTGLLQAVVRPGQLGDRDAWADDRRSLPVGIGRPRPPEAWAAALAQRQPGQ